MHLIQKKSFVRVAVICLMAIILEVLAWVGSAQASSVAVKKINIPAIAGWNQGCDADGMGSSEIVSPADWFGEEYSTCIMKMPLTLPVGSRVLQIKVNVSGINSLAPFSYVTAYLDNTKDTFYMAPIHTDETGEVALLTDSVVITDEGGAYYVNIELINASIDSMGVVYQE